MAEVFGETPDVPTPGSSGNFSKALGGRSLPPERDGEPPEPGRSELGSRGREGKGRGRRALHPPSCWAPRALLLVRCVGTPYPWDPISFASLRVHWRFPSLSVHTCVYSARNYKIRPGTPFLTHQNKVHFLKRSDWWDTLVTFFFLFFLIACLLQRALPWLCFVQVSGPSSLLSFFFFFFF